MQALFLLLIFVALFLLELMYFRVADRFNIIDKPNSRSSHTRITLRGGGVVFYFATFLFMAVNGWVYPAFFMGLTLIAAVSFLDDVRPLSSRFRLPMHFVAMGLMFYDLGLYGMPLYFAALAFVLAVGIINAYNFMDGINGITGAYSLVVLLTLWFVNRIVGFVSSDFIVFMIMAALVFNFFNFRTKARCFAGDVGSVSMAFVLVFLLGKLIITTENFNYILLLGVYGIDAVLTIVHRIMLRENITEAHRKHAYQLMANELRMPHLLVSGLYAALQLLLAALVLWLPVAAWVFVAVLALAYVLFVKRYFHLHKQ